MQEAAGFILYAHEAGQVKYLLLRNAKHGTWSFPKGHLEEGEDPRQGALRELREETGIGDVKTVPEFEAVLEYDLAGQKGDRKRLRLFLARTDDTGWTRSPEHDDGGWLVGEAALARLQHAELKDALLRGMGAVAATDPVPRVD
jgi:8-oxo-dGTP pyrophosphatase MutT (NUDIX family)